MKKLSVRKLVLSGLFIAIGIILPQFTGRIPQIGRALSPMHIPVLLAGFIVGPWWAALVGLILPFLNHLITSMPPLNTAITMTFELPAYGILAGYLYRVLPKKAFRIPVALIGAMLGGRIVWGIASFVQSRLIGTSFTWQLFASGAFVTAVPGIIAHLIIVPAIVFALERARLIGDNTQ